MIEEEPKVLSIDEIDNKSVEILLNNGMDKFSVFVDESAQEKNTLFILLHGATYSKSTWSAFIAELRSNDILNTEVSVIAPDLRGHGNTHTDNIDLHLDIMSEDIEQIYEHFCTQNRETKITPPVVIIGHSMGGVLAINLATRSKIPKIKAIITIDCVEDAHKEYEKLQSEISSEKVTLFTSIESAVQWYKAENPNVSSKLAEVSMTPRLKKQNNARLVYKMPFEATRNYWQGWFENMSEKFLSVKTYKISFLAGSGNDATRKMTTELTRAHMQGKFQLEMFPGTSHCIQEDDPIEMISKIEIFMRRLKPRLYL